MFMTRFLRAKIGGISLGYTVANTPLRIYKYHTEREREIERDIHVCMHVCNTAMKSERAP